MRRLEGELGTENPFYRAVRFGVGAGADNFAIGTIRGGAGD